MAEDGYRVFVSAVTEEFRAWRERAVEVLRCNGFNVKDQGDIYKDGGTLLANLNMYIQQCNAVVCLVGRMPGSGEESYPSEDHVKSIGAIPVYEEYLRVTGNTRASYTQWEYLLALHHGRNIFPYRIDVAAESEEAGPENVAHRKFREFMVSKGTHFEVADDQNEFISRLLCENWPCLSETLSSRLKRELREISTSLNQAVTSHNLVPRQTTFAYNHAITLINKVRSNTLRLGAGEIVTDYDDVSLLTRTIRGFGRGDKLLGLTDWDKDMNWWSGEDANEFLEQNYLSILSGAKIQRIFVSGNLDEHSDSRIRLKQEMQKQEDKGVEVHYRDKPNLPEGTQQLQSQCVLSHCERPNHQAKYWLAYNVELDSRGHPLRNVFYLDEGKIDGHRKMLERILKHKRN